MIAIRAARGGAGHTPGQDLRLTDPEGAATALTTPGWQFAGDLLSGDDETPMAVTVPNLAEELPPRRGALSPCVVPGPVSWAGSARSSP